MTCFKFGMLQGSTMTTYTIFRSKKNPASSSAKHLLDAINMISSRTADYSSVHLKRCVIPKYTCSVKLYIMAHGINTKQSKIHYRPLDTHTRHADNLCIAKREFSDKNALIVYGVNASTEILTFQFLNFRLT